MTDIKFKELDYEKYIKMREWCQIQFGHGAMWREQLTNNNSIVRWYSNSNRKVELINFGTNVVNAHFIFKDEKDATVFALRWSS